MYRNVTGSRKALTPTFTDGNNHANKFLLSYTLRTRPRVNVDFTASEGEDDTALRRHASSIANVIQSLALIHTRVEMLACRSEK